MYAMFTFLSRLILPENHWNDIPKSNGNKYFCTQTCPTVSPTLSPTTSPTLTTTRTPTFTTKELMSVLSAGSVLVLGLFGLIRFEQWRIRNLTAKIAVIVQNQKKFAPILPVNLKVNEAPSL